MALSSKEVAEQLRCPSGATGVAFGQAMGLRNLTMILSALDGLGLPDVACDRPRLLEQGCGSAGHLGYTLSQHPGLSYTGVEISPTMVDEARSFNQPFIAAGRAEFLCCAGEVFPLPDAHFDRALSVNTAYFWNDPQATLGEFARVLRPGGLLCLSFAESHFMRSLSFTRHGFRILDADDVLGWVERAGLPLDFLAKSDKRDLAVSEHGHLVERPYVNLLLRRGT